MNLGTSLYWVCRKMGDKVCLIENDTGESISYMDLWERTELLAKGLLKLGIKEDDKIVLCLPNCKEFIFSFYAIARIRAVSVPLSQYLSSDELRYIFNDCKPKAVISTADLYSKNLKPVVDRKNTLILFDEPKAKIDKCRTFSQLYGLGEGQALPEIKTNSNQIASINYTYRGLGRPIGAMLTHGNYHHGGVGYVRLTKFLTSQRVLVTTPMSHIFTLVSCVIVSLLRGATIIIMRNFVPNHIFKAISKYRIDFIMSVPTIYMALLRNYKKDKFDISSLKCGITGGSYLQADVNEKIRNEMNIELLQGYGLTETMPVSCNPGRKNRPESLGVPGHEVKVKIVDKKGRELAPNKIGEIVIGGPTIMCGYFNNDAETKKYLKKGWFYTGDIGYLDEDGYIYFEGLDKSIVKVGGFTVDIKEVENVLSGHPDIKKVKLRAVKDDLWGALLNADVTAGKSLTEKELKNYCAERLAAYKIPKMIKISAGDA